MKLNNGLLLSTLTFAVMSTGCVKKQDNVTPSGTYNAISTTATTTSNTTATDYNTAGANYDTTTNYETASPIVYDTGSSGATYSETVPDNTVITTGSNGANSYGSGEIIDNYSDTQSSGAFSTNSSGSSSSNSAYAYGGYSGADYSSPTSTTSSSSQHSYTSSSPSGGIQLQIAALKDYYAAQEFKNSLSLDPKYSVYIKRGALNKVIISGISSVNEANILKERRFPGAFIVHNSGSSSSSSSYSSGSSSTNYSDNYSYTDNSAYGGSYNSSSTSSHSSSRASSGSVGVQIGAFSSKAKAQAIANSNGGRYKAIVEKGTSRGKTIYRVILTGFSSRSSAKRALASGQIPNGFVTTVH
ncbi:Hemagglutinin-like protein [hydrothermal vent metagenome]|uniref:Hemagglutinin-like protein n=1 Tax=hydrothermal vent metagenome TaxID=652676 RepID=A0A1W1CPV3_9ZZZZ